MAPAHRITWPACTVKRSDPLDTSTPVARRPSKSTRCTVQCGADRQVEAVARRVEVAQVGAPAHAVVVVERDRADALAVGAFRSGQSAKPASRQALWKATWGGSHSAGAKRRTGIGPSAAVVVGAEVEVALQAPEEGEHPLEAPRRLPRAAQASKSSGIPRRKIWPLTALEPPVSLPRGTPSGPGQRAWRGRCSPSRGRWG